MKGANPLSEPVTPIEFKDLTTVRALAAENPHVSPNVLKAWVARRNSNGLVEAGAIVTMGHSLLIHRERFNRWLTEHLAQPPKPTWSEPSSRRARRGAAR